ncbi:MAG: CoB--CoM heterodisulfide reductase iron-sulfur subunit B family protein [Dehalococcoidia bacterium]|nr:CoB--CoM heterodisulfide reductase iron-sulfur subunit B family protein [Dehalococcoidia bacterium]
MAVSYAYYPGCTLKTSAREFDESTLKVCKAAGIELTELADWNCCGASSAHSVSPLLGLSLPARDLQTAEALGKPVAVACAMCFHRLKHASHALGDAAKLKQVNQVLGKEFRNTVKVEHLLTILGSNGSSYQVTKKLEGLKAASYYGCVLVRPKEVMELDDEDNPQLMDRIVASLGAETVEWDFKTECCGASLPLSKPEVVVNLSHKILRQARQRGAECVVVACPMCHSNLDIRQKAMKAAYPGFQEMPVYYFTQLMGLAMGFSAAEMHIDKHLTDGLSLLKSKGFI